MQDVTKLKACIYDAASKYKINNEYVMGVKIPSSYHTLVAKLATIRHKVKQGEHEPIMHAVEFKKMVRDLNLVDIQDDENLRNVTQFLHEDGALLHYDDWRNNLDDLYFVDPQWLCDVIFTVNQRKHHVKHGILNSESISLFLGDKDFSYQQGLTLLNKFEIALPLDKDCNRILLPLMLPEDSPVIINDRLSKERHFYKRYIIFDLEGQSFCLPGLWSRLLARVMNKVKEVRNIIDEQMPIMSQCSGTQEGCLDHNNAALIANTTTYQQIEDQ